MEDVCWQKKDSEGYWQNDATFPSVWNNTDMQHESIYFLKVTHFKIIQSSLNTALSKSSRITSNLAFFGGSTLKMSNKDSKSRFKQQQQKQLTT